MQKKLTIICTLRNCVPLAPQTGKNHVQAKAGVKTVKSNYFRRRRDQ